jgi:hypothetical protein
MSTNRTTSLWDNFMQRGIERRRVVLLVGEFATKSCQKRPAFFHFAMYVGPTV